MTRPHRTRAAQVWRDDGRVALPSIPVIETGPSFALETLTADPARAQALFDAATRLIPRSALTLLDTISRGWLARHDNAHLSEIDAIARVIGRPGTHFLSVQYEWACTCRVGPSPDGRSARLVRVLDWRVPGLGRHIVAARVAGPAGPYVTLTWPGFTGVIQAMAPGRYAAALNQAPLRRAVGLFPADWLAARIEVWQAPHPTAAHVLRGVFDTARTYAEARSLLIRSPIAAAGIFSLSGSRPDEACIIERTRLGARVIEGPAVAANHWAVGRASSAPWRGTARGLDSHGRAALMPSLAATMTTDFSWAKYPVLNGQTRLMMVADARAGHLVVQGFEGGRPATAPLDLQTNTIAGANAGATDC